MIRQLLIKVSFDDQELCKNTETTSIEAAMVSAFEDAAPESSFVDGYIELDSYDFKQMGGDQVIDEFLTYIQYDMTGSIVKDNVTEVTTLDEDDKDEDADASDEKERAMDKEDAMNDVKPDDLIQVLTTNCLKYEADTEEGCFYCESYDMGNKVIKNFDKCVLGCPNCPAYFIKFKEDIVNQMNETKDTSSAVGSEYEPCLTCTKAAEGNYDACWECYTLGNDTTVSDKDKEPPKSTTITRYTTDGGVTITTYDPATGKEIVVQKNRYGYTTSTIYKSATKPLTKQVRYKE